MSVPDRGGDPLGAMYFVAAILMGIGAIVVVALMFVPRDLLVEEGDAYVPGATPGYVGTAPTTQSPEQRQAEEELHIH